MRAQVPELASSSLWLILATVITLSVAVTANAQLLEINDPSLPASPDGWNLTEDTTTGLQWLDINITEGRTYGDMIGTDGTDEFAPGGDFEGFRYATFLELTGWTGGAQGDSPFKHLGFTSQFSSIGGYSRSRLHELLRVSGQLRHARVRHGPLHRPPGDARVGDRPGAFPVGASTTAV